MKIAFYSPHLSERGTEVALYDYARYNEEILGNESIIIYQSDEPRNNRTAIEKFNKRFHVEKITLPSLHNDQSRYVGSFVMPHIDKVIQKNKCDIFYMQKGGKIDGVISQVAKNIILACSTQAQPHGDRFAYVSKWLSKVDSGGSIPWLPIIIDLYPTEEDLRDILGISKDSTVLGRTGGMDTWNISWTKVSIEAALEKRKDLFFVFQNTPYFIDHERVKFIETTADPVFKSKFINTCDAMIHARQEGESFGQTIAEFSTKNKRIFTYSLSPERNHIDVLGTSAIHYRDPKELYDSLINFDRNQGGDWNFYKDHTPENGIKRFKEVFLD